MENSFQIWKKEHPFLVSHFRSEIKRVQKLPIRFPLVSYWSQAHHMTSSKPITGNQEGATMIGVERTHLLAPLGAEVGPMSS